MATTLSNKPLASFRSVAGLHAKLPRAFFNITPSLDKLDDHNFSSCCLWSQLTMTSVLMSRMLSRGLFRKSPAGYVDERELAGLLMGVEAPDPPGGVTVISNEGVTM
jgi:hypothetical protein